MLHDIEEKEDQRESNHNVGESIGWYYNSKREESNCKDEFQSFHDANLRYLWTP